MLSCGALQKTTVVQKRDKRSLIQNVSASNLDMRQVHVKCALYLIQMLHELNHEGRNCTELEGPLNPDCTSSDKQDVSTENARDGA